MAEFVLGEKVTVELVVRYEETKSMIVRDYGRVVDVSERGVTVSTASFGTVLVHESKVGKYVTPDEYISEMVELLALWFSRFQGYTAGTPENMVQRTRAVLTKHGRPPREPEVQRGG